MEEWSPQTSFSNRWDSATFYPLILNGEYSFLNSELLNLYLLKLNCLIEWGNCQPWPNNGGNVIPGSYAELTLGFEFIPHGEDLWLKGINSSLLFHLTGGCTGLESRRLKVQGVLLKVKLKEIEIWMLSHTIRLTLTFDACGRVGAFWLLMMNYWLEVKMVMERKSKLVNEMDWSYRNLQNSFWR